MDNQELILDKKLTPFEKAKEVAVAAYDYAEMEIPNWLLEKHLEQNHLEESIIDAKEAVLNAIKTMAIDEMKNLRGCTGTGELQDCLS